MKKNSKIHVFLETDLKEQLKKQAENEGISFAELCRRNLRESSKLNKFESMLEQIQKSITNSRGLYKEKHLHNSNKLKNQY